MSTTHTTSGIQVTEYEEADTEDLELTALDPASELWEALADAYSSGEKCPGCMWHESGWNPYTQRRWRECAAFSPDVCPAVNPRAIANALKRQAT